MIIRRWDDRMYGGRVKVYPWVLSEDWFFFFSILWYLAAKAFRGSRNCNHLPSFSFFYFLSLALGGLFPIYISFSLILTVHLLIIQVVTGVPVPSAAFLNLLWVAANKVVLFMGHFFINASRLSAAGI